MLTETPLVIFTILAQMSAGSFVVLGLIHLIYVRTDPATMDRVSDPALYAIGPILVLGLVASVFHLGSPMRAANALRHLDSSWLSREILAGLVFAALGATFAFCQWRRWLSPRLRQALAVAVGVVGMVLVFCISQVYTLRSVPAWDTSYTMVRFYTTTFLLGSLAVGAALVIASLVRARRGGEDEASRRLILGSVRGIAVSCIVILGVKFVGQQSYMGRLTTNQDPAAKESVGILNTTHGGFSLVAAILTFAGLAILGIFLAQLSRGKIGHRAVAAVAISAFTLILVGEVIGRMLFYASMVRIGV
jgi:anaerobic dimethyl sulfoxide reductase subunit C (anchor subunit)